MQADISYIQVATLQRRTGAIATYHLKTSNPREISRCLIAAGANYAIQHFNIQSIEHRGTHCYICKVIGIKGTQLACLAIGTDIISG